jgi:ABC-2 type transport system ATP-binding protein
MLTSYSMKDVAALCERVVVSAQGQVHYGVSLAGIIDQFSGSKIVTLDLGEGQGAGGLERFGTIQSLEMPRVKLRCERSKISSTLAGVLEAYSITDVAVEDPPLEEVIADLFAQVSEGAA